MAQYRFYVQRGSTGKPLTVSIIHDPKICKGYGLNCDFPKVLTTKTINGNATLGLPDTQMYHYFQATFDGPPREINENNTCASEFGGTRVMQFNF